MSSSEVSTRPLPWPLARVARALVPRDITRTKSAVTAVNVVPRMPAFASFESFDENEITLAERLPPI